MNAGTTAEAGGMHMRTIQQCQSASHFDMLPQPLQMHQPTPAYCHGNEDVVSDV